MDGPVTTPGAAGIDPGPPAPRRVSASRGAPSWKLRLLVSATAFVLSAGLVIAVGEVALQSLAPKSDPVKLGVKLPHSARQYGLQPNVRTLQTGVEVATNSLGFREKDYPVAKPAGVRRIVVLGDSYTLGVGVKFEDTFSKRLESELNASTRGYEVINFGVSGYNTVMELATFREVAAAFQPDLVLVAYVLNDAERAPEVGQAPPEAPGPARSPLGLIGAAHLGLKDKSMLYRYLSPKVGAGLGLIGARYAVGNTSQIIRSYDDSSVGWVDSRQALLEIVRHARTIKATTLVVVFPMILDFRTYPLTPAHDKITRFCRDHGIDVLDLLPRLRGEEASELLVFLDGHPNAKAHGIFADAIVNHLAPGAGARAGRAP